jgi:hypothetical protein
METREPREEISMVMLKCRSPRIFIWIGRSQFRKWERIVRSLIGYKNSWLSQRKMYRTQNKEKVIMNRVERRRDEGVSKKKVISWSVFCAFALGCTVITFLTGWGCSGEREPDVLIVAFFDVSKSAEDLHPYFISDFQKVLQVAKEDPRFILIMADRITAKTEETARFPARARLEASGGWLANPLKERKKREQELQGALNEVKTMLQQRALQSDILSAFRSARKVFESFKRTKYKMLIIFSDMIEQTEKYDFVSMKLDERTIQRVIQKEQQQGLIPDLQGVMVWIVGIGADEEGGIPRQKVRELERFWVAYLRAAKADIEEGRIHQTLLNFGLPE